MATAAQLREIRRKAKIGEFAVKATRSKNARKRSPSRSKTRNWSNSAPSQQASPGKGRAPTTMEHLTRFANRFPM